MHLPRIEILCDDGIDEFASKLRRRAEPVAVETKQKTGLAALEPIGFSAEQIRAARGNNDPIHPDYAQALARRLERPRW